MCAAMGTFNGENKGPTLCLVLRSVKTPRMLHDAMRRDDPTPSAASAPKRGTGAPRPPHPLHSEGGTSQKGGHEKNMMHGHGPMIAN